MTTLTAGSRLGPYEIRASIGAGGMGEVYRARDAKLDRDVAIKILPPALAADPSALARFEREAKAVAALSHPHILAIHDFGREGATVYAVMELLEGQTLRERLVDGALPVRKVIDIALQTAQGLAAAHEKGIIHRDLKPDNVFVTTSGRVKILDFGLAKPMQASAASETVAATRAASTPGMVVGTIGYMSPEQVTGAPVDHRTDIFAFGALVYEMLTGRPAFGRASTAETIAAILREDVPDVPATAAVPQPLERILRRCLEKSPAERFHSAHDVGIALEALLDRPSTASALSAAPAAGRARMPARAVIVASTLAAVALVAVAAAGWFRRAPDEDAADRRVRKFHVPAQRLVLSRETRPIISPDGEKVAFVAGDSLWIQELNQLDPRQLALSWRPRHLFWSPDSAFVGFVSESKLWKVPVNGGGQPIALGDVPSTGGGASGAWRADGKIVFSRSVSSSGLLELSQDGGEARSIVPLQAGDVDFHEPALLPGDNGLLLVVHRSEGPDTIAAIRGQVRKDILRLAGEYLVFPQYSSTGHIVFGRAGKSDGIWAAPFDPAKLETTGEPFLVASGAFFPSMSREGTLTFIRRIWSEPRQLVIVNRTGAVERAVGEPQPGLSGPVIAPDGRRIAVIVGPPSRQDVWIYDLQRSDRRRLTFLENDVVLSAWTASNRVVFTYAVAGRLRPVMSAQPADGSGTLEKLGDGCCASFSNNGTLVFAHSNEARESDTDLYYRQPGEATPRVLLDRAGSQESPTVSPNGAYVAYQSNESGRFEVYVRPFPSGAGQWQISLGGGTDARWSARGDKLWFRAYGNVLMEVDVKSGGGTFAFGEPREVFKGDPIAVDLTLGFAVLAGGDRFIAARRVADPDGTLPSITVVQNWFAEVAGKR